jgi:hypothetical protein
MYRRSRTGANGSRVSLAPPLQANPHRQPIGLDLSVSHLHRLILYHVSAQLAQNHGQLFPVDGQRRVVHIQYSFTLGATSHSLEQEVGRIGC